MAKKKPYEIQLLEEWTKRLGLQDWAIALETEAHPLEMKVHDALGCTSWEESTKSAFIQIVNPEMIEGLTRPFDLEEILIHELLHIKFSFLDSKDDKEDLHDRVLHQIIDDIARAFVDIKNKERQRDGKVSDLRREQQKADPQNEA